STRRRPLSSGALPAPKPVMLRIYCFFPLRLRQGPPLVCSDPRSFSPPLDAAPPPDVFHHALVLDLPKRAAFFDVLDAISHSFFDFFFRTFMLAERNAQSTSEFVIL